MTSTADDRPYKKKLIEVSLPLETINKESAREKEPFTRNHPRSLHLWWARRPLAAARAVLFAQLVDDPSARPEEFPTEEAQRAERERLHDLIRRLVVWENVRDEDLLNEARAEILKSTDGNPPPILDPFAGGGTIPLEAQRLGLEAHASDLNPVAVLINKALIEIPPMFRDRPPVAPGVAATKAGWGDAEGLAADVRAYGDWMRDDAKQRIGHLYPDATLPDGSTAPVIAWIWARTVRCPNPACGIEMPLVRSWWLGKKKGKEAYVVPRVVADAGDPSGKRVAYEIGHAVAAAPTADSDGTVGRQGARCVACDAAVPLEYVRERGRAGEIGAQLMGVAAEGQRQRIYVAPDAAHSSAACVPRPASAPDGDIPAKAPSFRVQAYGFETYADLFTNRQLVALTTFSDLVMEARERVLADALAAGLPQGDRLEAGGTGAAAYADAVATYLGCAVSRYADMSNSLCSWNQTNQNLRALFARQAIPMTWDFAEANPFGAIGLGGPISSAASALNVEPRVEAFVVQADARSAVRGFEGVISTDPPYYDNIGYSDLSDFFYVWLRRTLRGCEPSLFRTLLVPKADELVANTYRHGGKAAAQAFFEAGFRDVFAGARGAASTDAPMTVYYAFKQSETDSLGTASTGWETLLEGMTGNQWEITATWPLRSERAGRMLSLGTNALASSIVLALRPRPEDAPSTDRRGFIATLQAELPDVLRTLQQGDIAPVDLPQAAVGPGMAVFSRYSRVVEPDGSQMSVRAALARINEILDEVLSQQEGDFDESTRFAIAWYRQHGYAAGKFGDADNLARARVTSVEALDRDGILASRAGSVQLIAPASLPDGYDPVADTRISAWEVLHHLIRAIGGGGVPAAGALLARALSRDDAAIDGDLIKELAFLLFSIAEKNRATQDAIAFNTIATSWPDIVDASRNVPTPPTPTQATLDFEES